MILGYVFIVAALLAGLFKGFCGKKTSGYVREIPDAMLFNGVRMLLCIVIGFVLVAVQGAIPGLAPTGSLMGVTVLSGVTNAVFVVSWLLAVRKNAYMMVDVSLMIGCIIPAIGSAIWFNEPISPKKMIGFALLLVAIVLMNAYNGKLNGKMSPLGVLLMVVAGVSEGLMSFAQQIYKHTVRSETVTEAVYNFYSYVFAAILLLTFYFVVSCCNRKKASAAPSPDKKEKNSLWRVAPYILIMAICLFANSYFQTLATTVGAISSQVLYPVMKGAGLILSTAMAAVFFHERVTKWSLIGTAVAFAGLICINVL